MKGDKKMTFTIIDDNSMYNLDIESLDELYELGHDRYASCIMTIDWEEMTITFTERED